MRRILTALLTVWLLQWGAAAATWADVPRVVTDIRPVQAIVARIMAGLAAPATLIRHGYEPHDYRLRATEMSQLDKADIVFWVGSALTPALATQINRRKDKVLSIELLRIHHTQLLRYRAHDMFDDPSHVAHVLLPLRVAHSPQGHMPSELSAADIPLIDPNAWLNPDNAKLWADEIALQLAHADPDNATIYMANAWHAKKEIDDAVTDARATLRPFAGTPFVVYHDGYHYFEAYFDIHASAAVYLSHSDMPPRIQDVRRLLTQTDIPCAFVDPRFGDRTMREVIDETGATLFFVDPLGVHLPSGPNFYTNLLRSMAHDFAACTQAQY